MTMFSWPVRVYYEDTDAGGIVYHARYLYFLERARTEWLRSLGFNQSTLKQQNTIFVVRDMGLKFVQPAQLDDELAVTVNVTQFKKASIKVVQTILCQGKTMLQADVTIACLNASTFKPQAMPQSILSTLQLKESICD